MRGERRRKTGGGAPGAEAPRDVSRPTSELLAELAGGGEGERLSLGAVAPGAQERAYGLMLLLLALPEMIPMIGLSAMIAVPIFIIGGYMLFRGTGTSLPGWLQRRSLDRSHLEKAIEKTLPTLRRLERICRPRWPTLAGATRPQGLACMLMAVILVVPIPGLNILAASGVAGVGLGLLQRDGAVVAVALAISAVALAIFAALATGGGVLIHEIFSR